MNLFLFLLFILNKSHFSSNGKIRHGNIDNFLDNISITELKHNIILLNQF